MFVPSAVLSVKFFVGGCAAIVFDRRVCALGETLWDPLTIGAASLTLVDNTASGGSL